MRVFTYKDMKRAFILTAVLMSCACKFPVIRGSAPEILNFELLDGGSTILTNNRLYCGETPRIKLELRDKDINLKTLHIAYFNDGQILLEQTEELIQNNEEENYDFNFSHRLAAPLGDWEMVYTVTDELGLESRGSRIFSLNSLSDGLSIKRSLEYYGTGSRYDKVTLACEFFNGGERLIDVLKFKVRLDFTDGSSQESIHAMKNCKPGRVSEGGYSILFTPGLIIDRITFVPDSLEIQIR